MKSKSSKSTAIYIVVSEDVPARKAVVFASSGSAAAVSYHRRSKAKGELTVVVQKIIRKKDGGLMKLKAGTPKKYKVWVENLKSARVIKKNGKVVGSIKRKRKAKYIGTVGKKGSGVIDGGKKHKKRKKHKSKTGSGDVEGGKKRKKKSKKSKKSKKKKSKSGKKRRRKHKKVDGSGDVEGGKKRRKKSKKTGEKKKKRRHRKKKALGSGLALGGEGGDMNDLFTGSHCDPPACAGNICAAGKKRRKKSKTKGSGEVDGGKKRRKRSTKTKSKTKGSGSIDGGKKRRKRKSTGTKTKKRKSSKTKRTKKRRTKSGRKKSSTRRSKAKHASTTTPRRKHHKRSSSRKHKTSDRLKASSLSRLTAMALM